jgi:flagellar hook-basal body complex protein FliE
MAAIDYSSITPVSPSRIIGTGTVPQIGASETGKTSFSDLLHQAMQSLEGLSAESDRLTTDAALGKPVELHQVMLAATKAQIAMELFLEVRNRLIESWQEISRMPV